ncbi:hypothetical protein CRENBAI_010275, partial [Crenichthys baileyi]
EAAVVSSSFLLSQKNDDTQFGRSTALDARGLRLEAGLQATPPAVSEFIETQQV